MLELNPFSYEFHEDPYPLYRRLRDEAPLYRNERMGFWALSRFRDVHAALSDWKTYSSAEGVLLERMDPRGFEITPMILFLDPPRHDRLRKLVSKGFTPRRIGALEELVRRTAAGLLDDLARRGGGDFVKDFSAILPTEVIFALLGVPAEDRHQVREWIDRSLDRDPDSPEIPPRALEAMMESMRYWFALVDRLRRDPNDGLLCALFEAEIETDEGATTRLSDGELIGLCAVIAGGGTETVTKLLANAALLFTKHPEAWSAIRADPTRIPGAVEEVLRHSPPAQYAARTVMEDVEWHGTRIAKGERILLLIGAANRDDREYADPDRFEPSRVIPTPLGFGQGVHFCLGAALARLESRVALEEFSRRFPRYVVHENRCERVHMSNVHGFSSMPFERT